MAHGKTRQLLIAAYFCAEFYELVVACVGHTHSRGLRVERAQGGKKKEGKKKGKSQAKRRMGPMALVDTLRAAFAVRRGDP